MNLSDVLDEGGLQQDGWSESHPRFGDEGQLEVVGWSGRSIGGHKYYILQCRDCSQDQELHGEGMFRSRKGDLVRGQVPCACAAKPKWTEMQQQIRCRRKADRIGFTFKGWSGDFKGYATKILMNCISHGDWATTTVSNLLSYNSGCPECGVEASMKSDKLMIDSFVASGAFAPETAFFRSGRKNSYGWKVYWEIHCSECGEIGEATSDNLQKGKRSCACSMHRQRECYINWVIDSENPIAIKFGIANNSKQRIKKQDYLSVYTLKQHSVYTFPDVASCKQAERECRQELECCIVLKRDMKDGYTETTHIFNLDKIIEIYERNGGVKID